MLPIWSEEFSVHHSIIDEQHQMLFDLAHKAYETTRNHTPASEIKAMIAEFFEYMKTHFRDEECYMQAIGYPHLEEHKKIHRKIVEDMTTAVKNIRSADELKESIRTMSKRWLFTHILQEDMQIEKFRKEQMEKNSTKKEAVYTCSCENREHKLIESIHIFVSNSTQKIRCKECQQVIVFKGLRFAECE